MTFTPAGADSSVAAPSAQPVPPSDRRTAVRAAANRTWTMISAANDPAERYPIVDPLDQQVVASVPDGDGDAVEGLVGAASAAQPAWRALSLRERATVLRQIAARIRDHAIELAELDALCVGNPVNRTVGSVRRSTEGIEYFADAASHLGGATYPVSENLHYSVREPFGVVARITAYNSPAFFTALKIAPPLLAGNTVILKAPDPAPLSALRIGELVADLVPEGVLSVLTGAGPRAGAALVAHPIVRRVSFIGSDAVGRAVQRTAADRAVTDVSLELGGKNPMLVYPDADADRVASAAAALFTAASGQSCGSPSRLLVHADLVDAVVGRLETIARGLRLGDPLESETQMGPVVSGAHRQRILDIVSDTVADGATLVTGPDVALGAGLEDGNFVAPTVLADVRAEHRAFRDEVFGPVLTVTSWTDESDALELVNDTDYGLTASIFTNDLTRAHRVARHVQAGYVWVNTSGPHYWGVPFGGYKASGVGREEGVEELLSFTQLKSVTVALS